MLLIFSVGEENENDDPGIEFAGGKRKKRKKKRRHDDDDDMLWRTNWKKLIEQMTSILLTTNHIAPVDDTWSVNTGSSFVKEKPQRDN